MQTATRSVHPLWWVAAIALVVLCGAGIAAFMAWIPASSGKPADPAIVSQSVKPGGAARAQRAARTPVAAVCAECGVVQSVHEIDTKDEGSGIGAAGGAVVGGVLGNQEKHVKSTKSYEITVRFDDGASRVISQSDPTGWRAGDRVRVINDVIQSNT